jgi:hypothetical protein
MPATPGVIFKGAAFGRKVAFQFTRIHKHNITVAPPLVNTCVIFPTFRLPRIIADRNGVDTKRMTS